MDSFNGNKRGHSVYSVLEGEDWTRGTEGCKKDLCDEFDGMSGIERKTKREIRSFLTSSAEDAVLSGMEGFNSKITGVSTTMIRMDKVKGSGPNTDSGESRRGKSRTINHKIKRNEGFFDVIHDIKTRNLGYIHFIPLHSLWKQYISGLVDNTSRRSELKFSQLSQYMSQADFHGSIIKVISSRNKGYINVEGIVIKETKETFLVISKDNKPRTLLKKYSVFSIEFNCYQIILYGTQLCYHPSERVKHKFRHKDSLNIV